MASGYRIRIALDLTANLYEMERIEEQIKQYHEKQSDSFVL